jgi:hypothetical protein
MSLGLHRPTIPCIVLTIAFDFLVSRSLCDFESSLQDDDHGKWGAVGLRYSASHQGSSILIDKQRTALKHRIVPRSLLESTIHGPSAGFARWITDRQPAAGSYVLQIDSGTGGHRPQRELLGTRLHGQRVGSRGRKVEPDGQKGKQDTWQLPPILVISLKRREHRLQDLLPKLGDREGVHIVEAIEGREFEPLLELTPGEASIPAQRSTTLAAVNLLTSRKMFTRLLMLSRPQLPFLVRLYDALST